MAARQNSQVPRSSNTNDVFCPGLGATLHSPGATPTNAHGIEVQLRHTRAQLRRLGIRPSSRVALVLPDGPEAALAVLGVMSAAVAAPLNPASTLAELTALLGDLRAEAVIVAAVGSAAARAAAAELRCPVLLLQPLPGAGRFELHQADGSALATGEPGPGPAPDSLALVLHTSGTTARPKLVGLTHRAVLGSAHAIAASLELAPHDLGLVVMPLFHVHGLIAGVLAPLVAGSPIVVPAKRSTDLAGLLERSGATWLTAVPTLLQGLLTQAGVRLPKHRLRFLRSCSAALPPALGAALETTFGVAVIEAYGMTEGAHQIASNPLSPGARKFGSVGRPTGPEVAILNHYGDNLPLGMVGEVMVRGGSVITCYLERPDADAEAFENGWFRTGDLGRFDEDGYLFLTGRSKELINRAGEKIAPREVEDVLAEHPAVVMAVVFAVADERLGEQVAAAVVVRAAATERDLRLFALARLTPHKVPRRIVFCDDIPKGATGKLQRRGLAEAFGLADLDGDPVTLEPQELDGPVQNYLAEMWTEVLNRPVTDASARFMDLGGDSLAAMRLLARLREDLNVELSMIDLFDAKTITSQAEVLAAVLREVEHG